MSKDAIPLVYEHLRQIGDVDRLDVFLFTGGGDTLAAFGIARMIREFAQTTGTLVPDRCHSAGTLFALGANDIVMTRAATLSPIDPSIVGPLNPVVEVGPGQRQVVPLSVESVAGFKAMVTDEWGIGGEEGRSAALRLLAERVHPLALGNVFRTRQQIEVLARKLLAHRTDEEEAVARIVSTLARGLGSHDYPISRREALDLFGKQVSSASSELEDLLWRIHQDFATEMELRVPYDPAAILQAAAHGGSGGTQRVTQRLAMIESTMGGHVFEKMVDVSEVTVPSPHGMTKGITEEIVKSGWAYYA